MAHEHTAHLLPPCTVLERSGCSGPPAPARCTLLAPRAAVRPHVDHQNTHPTLPRQASPTARGGLQIPASQEMMVREQLKRRFRNSPLTWESSCSQKKWEHEKMHDCTSQNSHSLSLPLHFIYRSGSSCSLLTQSRQTTATGRPWCAPLCWLLIGQNTLWLQTIHGCTVSYYAALAGKKGRCYGCSSLQLYQYLCCKEWHLQLFHNYLAAFPAIHLQNHCYNRRRASSTITHGAVKHIYFTTQHLPSVFSEVLMACWYYSAFYSCSHIQKNNFFSCLAGNMTHKTHFL